MRRRLRIRRRRLRIALVGAAAGLLAFGAAWSADEPGPPSPGTTAVLGPSDGSAPTSSTMPSNSEEGPTGHDGSVAEERPPR